MSKRKMPKSKSRKEKILEQAKNDLEGFGAIISVLEDMSNQVRGWAGTKAQRKALQILAAATIRFRESEDELNEMAREVLEELMPMEESG